MLILKVNGPCHRIGRADPRLAKTGLIIPFWDLIKPVGRLPYFCRCRVSLGVLSPHPKIYEHFLLSCVQHLYSSGSTEQFCSRHQDKQIDIEHVLISKSSKLSNLLNFCLIIRNKTIIACPQQSKIYINSCMT